MVSLISIYRAQSHDLTQDGIDTWYGYPWIWVTRASPQHTIQIHQCGAVVFQKWHPIWAFTVITFFDMLPFSVIPGAY